MNFIIKREFFTNIVFEKDIESIPWEGCLLSLMADPSTMRDYEIRITGTGDYKPLLSVDKTKQLLETLDIIAFHRQSYIELGDNYAIYKEGLGKTRGFEYYPFEELNPSGNLVNDGSIPEIIDLSGKLVKEEIKNALCWYRRSLSVKYAYESLFFHILAVEALAGDIKIYPRCSENEEMKECIKHHSVNKIPVTNKDKLKNILGEEKYRLIYKKQIRNNLFHGKYVDENECHSLLDGFSLKISEHIKKELGLSVALQKQPRSKYAWKRPGRAICLYDTLFPTESIPKDTPTIVELINAYTNGFIPLAPKNIRLKSDEK